MSKPTEQIPDGAQLFRRAPKEYFNPKTQQFAETIFLLKPSEKSISANWDKYSTPEKTAIDPITKRQFFVGALMASDPRNLGLSVSHSPSKKNQAHTSIAGQSLFDEKDKYLIAGLLAESTKTVYSF